MKKATLGIAISLLLALLASLGLIGIETDSETDATTRLSQTEETHAKSTYNDNARWHGWSDHDPQVNLTHIFLGEINRRGKPTGFHSRPGGLDPENARLERIKSPPNHVGVYTAQIAVYDPNQQRWKQKFSSFFPDSMDHENVINSILHAWKNRESGRNTPWRGPSGHGFMIEGYLSRRGGINTAYPIYQRR